jgi:membrane protease YdiL (CAAX protease family)
MILESSSKDDASEPVRLGKTALFADSPWRVRDIFYFAALWLGLQILVGKIAVWLAPVWPVGYQYLSQASKGDNMLASLIVSLISFVLGFGVLAVMVRRRGARWSSLGLRRFNPFKAIGIVVLLLIGFIFLVYVAFMVVTYLVPGFNANEAQTNDFTNPTSADQRWIAFFALVILPPILEETIFRGLAFAALAKRWGYVWGAVLSSALFAVLHGQANLGVYTFILGLILCTMYVRFKSIGPGMLLHMVNNYLAFWAMNQK